MINVNDFAGATDSERINNAIRHRGNDIVIIPARHSDIAPERTWWLLDSAILLPGNTTIVIQNCTIKLSDTCRDNFFRSANCGLGIEDPQPLSNIHIHGEGNAVLMGADHPRSTGDSSKFLACPCPKNFSGAEHPTFNDLHRHSYGTDAGKEGESQTGDWRNIGILLAQVDHFSIDNIRIIESHAWAISMEACSYGHLHHLEFKAQMARIIDGATHNNENQDGVNLRNGCHDIMVSDILGTTGDDVVALTAIASHFKEKKGGELESTHVMSNDWSKRERGIRNVIVRNIIAYPAGGTCHIVRLLATDDAEIRNVIIDNIVDPSPADYHAASAIIAGGTPGIIGEPGHPYGMQQDVALFDLTISNVISNCHCGIIIPGGLQNSVISHVVNRNPQGTAIRSDRPDLQKDVTITCLP